MHFPTEQQPLWSGEDPELTTRRADVDRTRRAWQEVRLYHAVGSAEEEQYWTAYRRASDRLWEMLHGR